MVKTGTPTAKGYYSAARVKWTYEAVASLFERMEPMDADQLVEVLREIRTANATGDRESLEVVLTQLIEHYEDSTAPDGM